MLAIFDKPDPLEGPYFEETIYVTPSRLSAEMQKAIEECAGNAVRALGLTTGPVHAEFRVNESGPWVLEIAPRPIGGLCSRALRFGADRISLEELLLRDALGMPGGDAERENAASGVMMIPVPQSGIFEGVEGIEAARECAGGNGDSDYGAIARLRGGLAGGVELFGIYFCAGGFGGGGGSGVA